MIGRQVGVGGPAGRLHGIAGGVDDEMLGRVSGTDAAHISEVVGQHGEDRVDPITGRHDLLDAPAAQYVLDAKGDERDALDIVIERVAIGDALDDEPGSLVQGGGDMRLLIAEASAVILRQVRAERISQKARRVQHMRLPKATWLDGLSNNNHANIGTRRR